MAATSTRKHVVFDVVGTCFSYDGIFDALDARLGEKLRSRCILPKLLGYAWLEAAEREYTYLSISGRYKVFIDVFEALFWRMLGMAGVEDPRSFATEEDLAFVMAKYQDLEARPGIAACFEALRRVGFTVWAFTTGDKARVTGYFRKNGIDMPEENFKSCDSIGVGKPAREAYKSLLDQFAGEEAWFAAAHMWDVSAARENGFKGAYCTIMEKDPCTQIFGDMDVIADGFEDLAKKIIEAKEQRIPPNRTPVPNPVPSFWTATPSPLGDHRTTPDLPTTSDIVIIGAGFAGVATAYHILKQQQGSTAQKPLPSILILEARQICSGATGRNGGHVKPDVYFNVGKYASLYGMEAAAEMARFEAEHVYAVKDLIEAEGLDCDFHLTRAMDVCLDAEHARETEAAYRELVKADVADLRDVDFTPKQDAEKISGVKGAQCCFSFTAAHLWPSKLVHQLLQRLIDQGAVNVQSNTPVISVTAKPDPNGRWTIATPRGNVAAHNVVHATNAYAAHLLPEYTGRIVPVRGVCSRIVHPEGQHGGQHLVNTYGIRYSARDYDYLIPRADGSIVVGGARQVFWHKPELWFNNIRDDELVEEAGGYFDGYMQRTFRGWEDSGAMVDKVWTGIMGYSSDFMPHVGQVPDKDGQFIIAGFSGHGMPEILLASRGVAEMVCRSVSFEATGLPRLVKTTAERINKDRGSALEESLSSTLGDEHRILR
ncbi:hypothetical protein PspLS_10676 [Pyricularia sp. CBS 133598]|nr:hypothetical protein PspLS_10676 [Pyricularia sp. CBS 133598]